MRGRGPHLKPAIDFDEPHQKWVRNTVPKCARQSRMPRSSASHALPPISIPRRQYKLNQRYIKTCQPTHAHTRVHPIIPIQTHLSGKGSLYPDGRGDGPKILTDVGTSNRSRDDPLEIPGSSQPGQDTRGVAFQVRCERSVVRSWCRPSVKRCRVVLRAIA